MSSLARRSMRTTVAAAGVAALGVGLAGHALAAPAAPAIPGLDALGSLGALPGPDAIPGLDALGSLGAAPIGGSELPQLFTLEGPTVNTAAPTTGMQAAPAAEAAPVAVTPDAAPTTGRHAAPAAEAAPVAVTPDAAPTTGRHAAPAAEAAPVAVTPDAAPAADAAPATNAAPVTGAPSTSGLPALPPAVDAIDPIVDLGTGPDQIHGPEFDPQGLMNNNSIGGIPGADFGALITDFGTRAMSGAPLTQDNAIG